MAGFSLVARRETIRRIASSGTIPTGRSEKSMALTVDAVNAAIESVMMKSADARVWAEGAATKVVDGAVRGMDAMAIRVTHEILPIWYRLTPEVRMPLLTVCVTLLLAWLVHMFYIAVMRIFPSRNVRKNSVTTRSMGNKTTTELSSIVAEPESEKEGLSSMDGSLPPSPIEIGYQGSFESQDSPGPEKDEASVTEHLAKRPTDEVPTPTEESSVSEEEDGFDLMTHKLTSRNHSSDSPLEKAGTVQSVAEDPEKHVVLKTPKPSRSKGRRSSTKTVSTKESSLGSTMTPAGVRQSARIRSIRQLS